MRPICQSCDQRPRAIAYYSNGKVQYRRLCEYCIKRRKKIKIPSPKWQLAGYKKKPTCDRCGFRAKYTAQLLVYHIDGDMGNTAVRNLKTICKNCVEEVKRADLPWRAGDLEEDR